MFTGIVEEVGKVAKIEQRGENRRITIEATAAAQASGRAIAGGTVAPHVVGEQPLERLGPSTADQPVGPVQDVVRNPLHPYAKGLMGASRRYIMSAVEASLRRLRTDWIDLYQQHRPDPKTPIEETLRALDDLIRQGLDGSLQDATQVLYVSPLRALASDTAQALHRAAALVLASAPAGAGALLLEHLSEIGGVAPAGLVPAAGAPHGFAEDLPRHQDRDRGRFSMRAFARSFKPIFSMASGVGPMNAILQRRHTSANSAFSERKP